MEKEQLEQVEELLDDSMETLQDKNNFTKTKRQVVKECAQRNGIDSKQITRSAIYVMNQGKGWLNGDPLLLDPKADEKDKITPVFFKLITIFDDLSAVGKLDILKPYLTALEQNWGIKITYENSHPYDIKDTQDVLDDVIDQVSRLTTNIDALSKQISEEAGKQAEELNFTPQKSYAGVAASYKKIMDGKGSKEEDKLNTAATNSIMMTNALSYLIALNDKQKVLEDEE